MKIPRTENDVRAAQLEKLEAELEPALVRLRQHLTAPMLEEYLLVAHDLPQGLKQQHAAVMLGGYQTFMSLMGELPLVFGGQQERIPAFHAAATAYSDWFCDVYSTSVSRNIVERADLQAKAVNVRVPLDELLRIHPDVLGDTKPGLLPLYTEHLEGMLKEQFFNHLGILTGKLYSAAATHLPDVAKELLPFTEDGKLLGEYIALAGSLADLGRDLRPQVFFSHAQQFAQAMAYFKADEYKQLTPAQRTLLQELPSEGVSAGLRVAFSRDCPELPAKHAPAMVRGVPVNDRSTLIHIIDAHAVDVGTAANLLHRSGQPLKHLAQALLRYNSAKVHGQTLAQILAGCKQAPNAKFILDTGLELLMGDDGEQLTALLHGDRNARTYIDRYRSAMEHGERNVATLALHVAALDADAQMHRIYRTELQTMTDVDAAALLDLEAVALQKAFVERQNRPARVTRKNGMPWIERIIAETDEELQPRLRAAYDVLGDRATRLRDLWYADGHLASFCDHVTHYAAAPAFHAILADSSLFVNYAQRLGDARFAEGLRMAIMDDPLDEAPNRIRKLLLPPVPEGRKHVVSSSTSGSRWSGREIDTVRIYGGLYNAHQRDAFSNELAPYAVLVVDERELTKNGASLAMNANDFAVLITSCTSHTSGNRVRKACTSAGAQFHRCYFENVSLVATDIRQYLPPSTTQSK